MERAKIVFSLDTQSLINPSQRYCLMILMNSGLDKRAGPGFSTTFRINSRLIIYDFSV